MTDTHRDTIMRLMVEVGTGCTALADDQMRKFDYRRIQCSKVLGVLGHLAEIGFQGFAGHRLDHLASKIDADTVFPARARIEQQRHTQACPCTALAPDRFKGFWRD